MSRPVTDSSGQIVKRDGDQDRSLVHILEKMKGEIARALPRHVTPDRMLRVALTALRTTPTLLQCTQASVLGSVMSAAQLGLEPNTPLGLAYLAPFKGQCQLMIGYQGYLELARRSGLVSAIYAYAVREGDSFRYSMGLHPELVHVPSGDEDRERRNITHVYAVAHLKDSSIPLFVVLTKAQVDGRKARGRGGQAWNTDYEAMALKTAIRALWRWLPKTAEVATAAAIDEAGDDGRDQSQSWDPSVTEALQNNGITVEAQVVSVNHDQEAPQAAANA